MRIRKKFGESLEHVAKSLVWGSDYEKELVATDAIRVIDQELFEKLGDKNYPYPLRTVHGLRVCARIGMIADRSKNARYFLRDLKKLLRTNF